jgi:hypothetical protein
MARKYRFRFGFWDIFAGRLRIAGSALAFLPIRLLWGGIGVPGGDDRIHRGDALSVRLCALMVLPMMYMCR